MADFTVAGKSLKSRNMDLFVQANVVRRFGRLSFIMSIIQEHLSKGDDLKAVVSRNIPAILLAVGSIDDPDFNFIRNACLDTVEVNLGGAWVKLRTGESLQWGDMQLMDLCMVLGHVIQDVFFPFFQGLAALSPREATTD